MSMAEGPVFVNEAGELVEAPVKKVNRGVFVKGDPRINRGGTKREVKKKIEVSGEGLLRAMRHVLANDPVHDDNAEEKACRKWYDEDPKGFLLKSHALEEEERERSRPKEEKAESGPDVGHDHAMKVLDRLLTAAGV